MLACAVDFPGRSPDREIKMDEIRETKVRMLRRLLEKIEQEVRIVPLEEERPVPNKQYFGDCEKRAGAC
jgi:hypothetical protein